MPDKLSDGEEIDWPVPYWFVDAGAALMLVLLAAIDEGLARRRLRASRATWRPSFARRSASRRTSTSSRS